MPELTNEEKIDVMSLASRIVCNDEAEAIADQPKDKNILGLYRAMIKAITESEEVKVTGPPPIVVSKETTR